MMSSEPSTPPISRSSSCSSRRSTSLSLDLSDLPGLIQPAEPSNTLIITNLQDAAIFSPPTLAHIRDLITQHSPSGIHAFSPLRALRRLIVSFPDIHSATTIRALLDGGTLFSHRVRVYFGEPTPTEPLPDQHLQAPRAQKQFFISPPPSPPHGWQSKEEDPPNKEVHADDLVVALERLSARADAQHQDEAGAPTSALAAAAEMRSAVPWRTGARQRSGSSTLLYDPQDHGHSPSLPAIALEDTTDSPQEMGEDEAEFGKLLAHTARPPVELMADA